MAGGQDKWIRSVKHNPAGKVVADPEGNRWEWERAAQEDTSRLQRKLNNDELAIEQTDLVPNRLRHRDPTAKRAEKRDHDLSKALKTSRPHTGGGINPYDNSGKPRRR